ncbi:MAG: hypothetical protein U0T81_03785 [Saprospiraceae bacterium]
MSSAPGGNTAITSESGESRIVRGKGYKPSKFIIQAMRMPLSRSAYPVTIETSQYCLITQYLPNVAEAEVHPA